jgi:hypothetical protein
LSATLNQGISTVKEKYFAYLGSDDMWLSTFLERRVHLLEQRPDAVLGYGHCLVVDENDEVVACTSDWARYRDGDVRQMLLSPLAPSSPTVLYRTKALQQHGWNEQSRLEDYELYLRLSADGPFAFDPRPLAAWRRHGTNTSRDLALMWEECLAAQTAAASYVGLTSCDLERGAAALRFRAGAELLDVGQKRKALVMTLQNLAGAPSAVAVLRRLLKLSVPYSLLRRRSRRLARQARSRYGPVPV